MRISMMVSGDVMQVNMTPETPAETVVCEMLTKHAGPATVFAGVNVSECRGGYLRDFGADHKTLAIVIRRAEGETV